MYTTNLPDVVIIPELLLPHVESLVLTDEAKAAARTWVTMNSRYDDDLKEFWLSHLRANVDACKQYGVPECVRLFSYVCQLIEEIW